MSGAKREHGYVAWVFIIFASSPLCTRAIQSKQALPVGLFSIAAHRPACLDVHWDTRNEALLRRWLNLGKMRHSPWGAHLHHESGSILQRCTQLYPRAGNALTPKSRTFPRMPTAAGDQVRCGSSPGYHIRVLTSKPAQDIAD